jgi:exosortase A-associated hydrolase 2
VNPARVSGHFIDGQAGPIHVVLRRPTVGAARGCVLVVPPFAEEMNKCRRMIATVAIELAAQGVSTVMPDLHGTGDSSGDFADASWHVWRGDLARTVAWAQAQGSSVTGVLAIRLGCALAVDCVADGSLAAVERAVLWQPVLNGDRFLMQFLRLRVAASLMQDRKESLGELRAWLQSGRAVGIAGYTLSPALAKELSEVSCDMRLRALAGRLHWMEVVRSADSEVPVATIRLIDLVRAAGRAVQVSKFEGEPFWSSTEIVVNRPMGEATVRAFAAT